MENKDVEKLLKKIGANKAGSISCLIAIVIYVTLAVLYMLSVINLDTFIVLSVVTVVKELLLLMCVSIKYK